MKDIELLEDPDSFLPEHQQRANRFARAGQTILSEQFPELFVEIHDGLERDLDFWTVMRQWAEKEEELMPEKENLMLADRFADLELKTDRESANISSIVFNIWDNNRELIVKAIEELTNLVTTPEYDGILEEESGEVQENKSVAFRFSKEPSQIPQLQATASYLFKSHAQPSAS